MHPSPVNTRVDALTKNYVSIMSQIKPISYPKVHQRPDGKIEVIIYYEGKRMRLQNGSLFGIDLKPNSFPIEQRLAQGNILAATIYSELLSGTKPLNRKDSAIVLKTDLMYIEQALLKKLKEGHSKHHQKALRLAYNRIKERSNSDKVNSDIIERALSYYNNNTSYNTLRRNMNILCRLAVKLGMKENPVEQVKRKKEKAQLNKAINNTSTLLNEIKAYNENLHLCCLLTYGCLLRPHREVRELTWGDFTEDLSYIRLSGDRNKSGRNRIVPVPYYVKEVLKKTEDHLNIFSGKEEPFAPDYFKGLWSSFKKRSKLLEENQTLYSFRHTGAIDVYKRTGSIEKLKAAMGHSNIMVSLTYLRGLDVAELKEEDMPVL